MSAANLKILSVVFSFRNEEDVLPELIARSRAVLKEEVQKGTIGSYELIFVDDHSVDSSPKILLEQAKEHGDIRIVTMSRRFGVSPCSVAGMEYACGDAVVYMDADLQDPPEVIPELLEARKNGDDIDVVHTVRISRSGESKLKILLTSIGYWILDHTMEYPVPRNAGDFKLLSRRVVDHIVGFKEKYPFLRAVVCWVGFNQAFVRYHRQPRGAEKTKFPIYSPRVIWNFLDSAVISFSSVPLRFALTLGTTISFITFLLMMYTLILRVPLPNMTPMASFIVLIILFLGGIQLIAMGIFGMYLNSIFIETKGRPNYIVKETYGFPKKLGT